MTGASGVESVRLTDGSSVAALNSHRCYGQWVWFDC